MTPDNQERDSAVPLFPKSIQANAASRKRRRVPVSLQRHRGFLSPLRRSSAVLLACAVLLSAFGCSNGISGGSVPSGGSRLAGRVVKADDPLTPLANAKVHLVAYAGAAAGPQDTVTDTDGSFSFPAVSTGAINGAVQVTVTPSGSSYQSLQWAFILTNRRPETLVASLAPASLNVNIGKSVTITPAIGTVKTGDTIRFNAEVRDAAGNLLPIAPTLLFDGDFGTINGDGTFTSTADGVGKLTAFWYGGLTSTAQVISDPKATTQPPPPPPDTGGTGGSGNSGPPTN